MAKPIVILCACGGYHPKSVCPKAWAEFNRWFATGLADKREMAKKAATVLADTQKAVR